MKKILILLVILLGLYSCENQEWDFPDFEYSTVYFSYQYPVRTLTMGEDIFDTTLDNEHKCKILATWGGGYSNDNDVLIDFVVDESLCDNLYYLDNDAKVEVMPSNYYTLASNQMIIPKGSVSGGVEVKLEDAFFNDAMALKRNYVIPLLMKNVTNADSILVGKTNVNMPNPNIATDWEIVPKNYSLYAIKYINTWDGHYLRRGTDMVTENGITEAEIRHKQHVEDDEVVKLNTQSLTKTEFPLTFQDENGVNIEVSLVLEFNNDGKCTITTDSNTITATGTGTFVKKGEKKSWGNKDRDVLYLDYSVDLGTKQYTTKDTLVARDRGVGMELFNVIVK
ncbi:DUF5627 domain-containing protein [Confluentibacter sediminis]|uniref:DUF5627 domain-containing protein n=1 Tax=Confluentibacter sediminis TaxID=2219045 RepID=UPI000DAEEFB6|nr:DUF5627 domain-containing protein [Confluentibacter sediminis]